MRTIRKHIYRAKFSVHRPKRINGISLALPNYRQEDYHSCGYLAALTTAEYLVPGVCPKSLLMAVRPSINSGTTQKRVMKALSQVGIKATYREDLTILHLLSYILKNIPVIVSVYPDGWYSDHWCIVQGFSNGRVHLTNHPSLPVKRFTREWISNWGDGSVTGAGLICERK